MNGRLRRSPRPLLMYLLLLLAFALGVFVDRQGWLPGSLNEPAAVRKSFRPFWQTWNLVDRYYVDREAVQPTAMTRGAIKGMLKSLGDEGHTTYLTPEEVKELEQSLQGYFEGIGARMTVRDGRPTVVNVLPNSPAKAAGLKAGDAIIAVNGKDVQSMPLSRVVTMVRGPAGTTVQLKIVRSGVHEPIAIKVERKKVDIQDVTWHLLPGTPVAHIALQEFGDQADTQLRAAITGAKQQGATSLIIDVRGNPGGLRDQAIAVTSEFLSSGTVFIEQNADGKRTSVPVTPGGIATEIPIVVLIDEGTASSAEIFAGAIEDYQRGKLVGTKTFGTGTVLKPFALSDGSAVLLAVQEWFTPLGRQIWHKGIQPNIDVPLPSHASILMPDQEGDMTPEQLKASSDRQLLRALELLESPPVEKGNPAEHGPAARKD